MAEPGSTDTAEVKPEYKIPDSAKDLGEKINRAIDKYLKDPNLSPRVRKEEGREFLGVYSSGKAPGTTQYFDVVISRPEDPTKKDDWEYVLARQTKGKYLTGFGDFTSESLKSQDGELIHTVVGKSAIVPSGGGFITGWKEEYRREVKFSDETPDVQDRIEQKIADASKYIPNSSITP